MDLREALRNELPAATRWLGGLLGGSTEPNGLGKFEALNLSLWSAGAFVYVPRNVRIERPLQISRFFPTAPGDSGPSFVAQRLLVVLEDGADLTLVDECEGGDEGLLLNCAAELVAGPASRLRYIAVQRLGKGVRYHVSQRVSAARNANTLTAIASLGAGTTKADFGAALKGPGANVELVGFLFGEGKQHFDHHTVHAHHAGHAYSNLDFKTVLKDRARSAYTGLIRIEKDAPESEAYQENRNLLLNDGAKAESIPELEILTDEVRCTHGATMGTLDPEHLFYLMCRGLSKQEAIRLIVGGFVEPTLSRLPPELGERLRVQVDQRIKNL